MSRVYKQAKSNKWTMEYRDEHGKVVRRTTGTTDKGVAQRILAEEERAVDLRRLGIAAPSPKQSRTPIEDVLARYLSECSMIGNVPEVIDDKRRRLAKVVDWTGIRNLAELTPAMIRGLLDDQLAELARSTRNAYLSHIRGLCDYALRQSPPMLSSNPAKDITPGYRTKRASNLDQGDRRRCLWTPEIPQLLAARPENPYAQLKWDRHRRPLYIVAMGTGFRRSTLNRIEPWMIKLEVANPHIAVPSDLLKSGRRLVMPIRDPSVRESIEMLLRVCSARKPFKQGRPNRWLTKPFAPVPKSDTTFLADITRAGIPRIDEEGRRVVFHSLRATFATQLALNGVPPQVTMELMDHADIKTTLKFYTMVGVTDTSMFMDRMPAIDQAFDSAIGGMRKSMRS